MSARTGLATVSLRRRVTVATVLVFAAVLAAVIVVVNAAFGVILNRSVTALSTTTCSLLSNWRARTLHRQFWSNVSKTVPCVHVLNWPTVRYSAT
jgi:hypothetical protein